MISYSIIIPVYNSEKTLSNCIESLLRQTIQMKSEIIMVNDGSTDLSSEICNDYANRHSNIRVIHQNNQGASAARNRGIEAARGEWISFVDADDTVTEDYLSCFESVRDKADINFFGSRFISSKEETEKILDDSLSVGWTEMERAFLLLKCGDNHYEHYGYTWNKFFKADIIHKHNILFTETLRYREDEVFTNDYIIHANSLRTMSYIGYNYHYTLNGLSGKSIPREMYGIYSNKSKPFLYRLRTPVLQLHVYNYVVSSAYKSFELEQKSKKYLFALLELLSLVKDFNHLTPYATMTGFFFDIQNYYKSKEAKKRVDVVLVKKRIKAFLGL